jgi:SAM-dependent methyltransferase
MSQHSVEAHLGLDIADYDREIRRLVPHYDELVAEGIDVLLRLTSPGACVLDLGCGTGRMTGAILAARSDARVTLLDVDRRALGLARERFRETAAGQLDFVAGSFLDPLPRCDAVIASLSLHHVRDLSHKTRVYRNVFDALPAGGLFLLLDASVSAHPTLSRAVMDRWAHWMGEQGIDDATAREHFASWSKEEHYQSLADELQALADAGFAHPECFFRRGPIAVYGGLRPPS